MVLSAHDSAVAEPAAAADSLRSAALAAEPQAVRPLWQTRFVEILMQTTRRSAMAGIAAWFSLFHRPTSAQAAPQAPARKISVSLQITDYLEKPGSYRWDAETAIATNAKEAPTKATTWGFREIGTLGRLRAADPISGYSMVFENGPSPCSTWNITVKDPAGSDVVAVSFAFQGTPPVWPSGGAA